MRPAQATSSVAVHRRRPIVAQWIAMNSNGKRAMTAHSAIVAPSPVGRKARAGRMAGIGARTAPITAATSIDRFSRPRSQRA
jgi:hypothetical protein